VAHFPPVRRVMSGTAPEPVPGARRTWLALLLGAGAVALLAGLAWGIFTLTRAQPGDPPAASPALPGQQARYQVTRVRVAARPRGMRVRWSPPSRTIDLQSGRRYCFVVGTVVRSASGQQGTATAPAVCTLAR